MRQRVGGGMWVGLMGGAGKLEAGAGLSLEQRKAPKVC